MCFDFLYKFLREFSHSKNYSERHDQIRTRGADKSLARPGRKQATVTKLGNYSTYSQWSSIHFLARCSEFCKPHKKIRSLSVQQGRSGSNDLGAEEKFRTFNCFFLSREQVAVRRGQIRLIGWVIKTMGAQVDQFLLGCMFPESRGIVVQKQDPLVDFTVAFFLQISFNCNSTDV